MGKYRKLFNFFDRIYMNDLNKNFDDVDADIKVQKARVDNLITGNPQPAEVMDLRTDTDGVIHGTAWDRFESDESKKNAKFQEIGEQLADVAYNLNGLPNGSTNDASSFIQSVLNSAKTNKVRKIKLPKSTYRLNSSLFIETDDLELDFSGSTILSYAKASSNKQGEIGIINPRGSFVETDVDFISYFRSVFNKAHTPPANSPVLLTYEAIEQISNYEYHAQGKITTSNNNYFNVGDEILLIGWTRPEGYPYVKEKFEPEIRTVAKVLAKDATYIYVDYYSPFKYPAFVNNTIFKSRVHKIKTIKNIAIKNANIINMNNIATLNAPTATEKAEALSGITPFFVDGLKLDNVKVENTVWNAIYPWSCRNIEYNNIHAEKPQAWGGGQGYTIQHMGCRDIEAHNITGFQVRHVVDFSCNSHNAAVYDSFGIDGKDTTLLMHGMCEHDITFIRCKGMFGMGSGLAEFPNVNANIKIDSCDLFFVAMIDDTRWVNNVLIDNSRIKYISHPPFMNFTTRNSEVTFDIQNYAPKPNARDQVLNAKLIMDNVDLILYTSNINNYAAYFLNYDKIVFKNIRSRLRSDSVVRQMIFNVQGVTDLVLDNVTGQEITISYKNERSTKARILLNNNDILLTAANTIYFLDVEALTNCNLFIEYKGNRIENTGTTSQFFVLDVRSANYINSKVVSNTHDNFFKGNPNALIHYVYTAGDGIVNAIDHDNIVQNKAGGALFTTGKHTVI
ncbi:hypothetical protein LC048_13545 [Mesobacillus subterraneus]|uniref:hypothetical protein n=1 Tax=Mesobacillus subterraneus TaxID=285983 RepID=UPI001CFF285F|nr:hypothetical protein [Mesobacillus subterraneus]WLR53547.1 hypothetical protein LC048_13545 [Mesobacillus subterraneus]